MIGSLACAACSFDPRRISLVAVRSFPDDDPIGKTPFEEPRMALRCLVMVFVLSLISAAPVHAAKVKVWHQHLHSHFDKAKFQQAVVTSEGVLDRKSVV